LRKKTYVTAGEVEKQDLGKNLRPKKNLARGTRGKKPGG
jgi:hypothetical protein